MRLGNAAADESCRRVQGAWRRKDARRQRQVFKAELAAAEAGYRQGVRRTGTAFAP